MRQAQPFPGLWKQGFTLIELIVVMAILAMLVTLALPRYMQSMDRSKDAVLKHDLAVMRDALDKFYSDIGKYPDTLDELVAKRYLRRIPEDPITESAQTWVEVPPPTAGSGRIYDIRSGAPGKALNGTDYSQW
jgi:general secretion pathway protein G